MSTKHLSELDGIRFWLGYRASHFYDNRPEWENLVRHVFVPSTIQQMIPLGLQAYLPALTSHDVLTEQDLSIPLPDEVALVVYENLNAYDAAVHDNAAGRSYGALHQVTFNFSNEQAGLPPSTSMVPELWSGSLPVLKAVALIYDRPDWHTGSTRVFLASRKPSMSAEDFRKEIESLVRDWLVAMPKGVDSSLVYVNEDWVLYWEHQVESDCNSFVPALSECTDRRALDSQDRSCTVPPIFTRKEFGVSFRQGELLNVRLLSQ